MGLSLKGIFNGIKKVGGIVDPVGGAVRDALGGKSASEIGHGFVDNSMDKAKAAAVVGAGYGGYVALSALAPGAAEALLAAGGKYVKDNLGNIIGIATGIASGVEGYNAQKKADELREQALNAAKDDYAARAPLRQQGMAQMLAAGQSNPFAPKPSIPAVGSSAPPNGVDPRKVPVGGSSGAGVIVGHRIDPSSTVFPSVPQAGQPGGPVLLGGNGRYNLPADRGDDTLPIRSIPRRRPLSQEAQ